MMRASNALRSRSMKGRLCALGAFTALFIVTAFDAVATHASDHADPLDFTNTKPLEPGITDLFVFPVLPNDAVCNPYERLDKTYLSFDGNAEFLNARQKMDNKKFEEATHMVFILCVRRALQDRESLKLDPYTYQINIDDRRTILYDDAKKNVTKEGETYAPAEGGSKNAAKDSGGGEGPAGYSAPPLMAKMSIQEARARYGGMIAEPGAIKENIWFRIKLRYDKESKDVKLKHLTLHGLVGLPQIEIDGDARKDLKDVQIGQSKNPDRISFYTGVRDDPFIFPAFFGTNTVAMVFCVPTRYFSSDNKDWLIWATSSDENGQIDHVGRSLRTQNPRFEILNTVHPSAHIQKIEKENNKPGLTRDIGLRLNLPQLAAYRRWDFVPDVMIYKRDYPVGFPNGRLLGDDVAALLAQFGDTALLELSYQNPKGGWPRATKNDMPFHGTEKTLNPNEATFPYLAKPHPEHPNAMPPMLTTHSKWVLGLIAAAVTIAIAVATLILNAVYRRWKNRRKYL
jgi:hypothetical protein